LKKLARDKHSSLLQKLLNLGPKSFITLGLGEKIVKKLILKLPAAVA
jgi:hypothetical protein